MKGRTFCHASALAPAVWVVLTALLFVSRANGQPFYAFEGHYYTLTSEPQTWTAAEAAAVARGGHLVTINSAAENDFLVTTFLDTQTSPRPAWMGLSDAAVEGLFVWASGEPVSYTNWKTGEPNDYQPEGGEDYGALNWHFSAGQSVPQGQWNDTPLAGTVRFNNASDGPYAGIIELLSLPGDLNFDGAVDAGDYVSWRKTNSAPAGYDLWQAHFGVGTPANANSSLTVLPPAPEPTAVMMVLTGLAALASLPARNFRQAGDTHAVQHLRAR